MNRLQRYCYILDFAKKMPLDQKKVLFEQLGVQFERKDLIHEAKRQGISERTAERWNDKWQETGQVIKLEHGHYRKVG